MRQEEEEEEEEEDEGSRSDGARQGGEERRVYAHKIYKDLVTLYYLPISPSPRFKLLLTLK